MPSLPPETVLIKRKRTAEPVESLRVHESTGKRQRRADYIYQRQPTSGVVQESSSSDLAIKQSNPSLLPIPLPSKFDTQAGSNRRQDAIQSGTNTPGDVTPPLPTGAATPIPRKIARPPRRFHISRSSISDSTPSTNLPGRKRRNDVDLIFSERKVRPKNPEEQNVQAVTVQPPSPRTRPQKKPGLVKYSRTSTPSAKPKQDLPLPIRNVSGMSWDVNSEELVAQMQAYTLQEIGKNIAASEAERPAYKPSTSTRLQTSGPSKFKPKKPTLRYAERHPEEKAVSTMDIDGGEEDYMEEVDTEDDSDYIIDTYVRVPVEALESDQKNTSFGFLVLDSQPDIDAFYRDETDSDDEEEDEDEDENAENHYTADYPDDEVASDDEFDLNAYHYSRDIDEFDEEVFSDDETEATKYPWMKVKKPVDEDDDD